jgi:hypothetical protein
LKARLLILKLVLSLTAIAVVLVYAPLGVPASGDAAPSVPQQCAADPHVCGFPDATNTGVPNGMTLKDVPGQVSSGPGWSYHPGGWVEVTGNGAVLSGLYIPCNLDISASNVTIDDDEVVTSGDFGISLRHTAGVTIENSTVSGQNATSGRVDTAIKDIYGDSTGMVIEDNNVSQFRTAVEVSTGLVAGNYIHSPGYIAGDHTNGIYDDGSDAPLTIEDNTVFISQGQTDAITLDASSGGQTVANKTVVDNLLAGGGYAIYGGASEGNTTSNVVIVDNWFSQQYYPLGGLYGPAVYFDTSGTGDVWSDNVWSGQTLSHSIAGSDTQMTTIPPP